MTTEILKITKPKRIPILDIGSNDGITLKNYDKKKYNVAGIEPQVPQNTQSKHIRTEKIFFNSKNYEIETKYANAKIITATNVFAHNDKIQDFVNGIRNILDFNGIFVQNSLFRFYAKKTYDTIYHEHYSYLSITPLNYLFNKFQLKIFKITVNLGASGPALRVYIKHENNKIFKDDGKFKKYSLRKENNFKKATYNKFKLKIDKINKKILNIIKD